MMVTKEISSANIIVVEGSNDALLFSRLLDKKTFPDIQIISAEGKDKIPALIAEIGQPRDLKIQKLAIICDADYNCQKTFNRISKALKTNHFPIPDQPGQLKNNNAIKIGIYIMPDNSNPGMLEDLWLKSVADKSVMKDLVFPFIKELEANPQYLTKEKPKKKFNAAKATARIYFATCVKIASNLDDAYTKQYLAIDHPCFNDLKQFLNQFAD